MNLKIGGSNVGKIMYNGQEFGGATKLEPGTILYLTEGFKSEGTFNGVHLKNTTKDWSNIDGIHLKVYYGNLSAKYVDDQIYSDNFKSLDTGKKYNINSFYSLTISRSIIDGEYRLNASVSKSDNIFVVSAL